MFDAAGDEVASPSNSPSNSPYKEIRAVTRAIDLIEAAADLGWARIGELSAYSGIDRATLYRMVHTLERRGFLTRRPEDGAVALTDRILQIADAVRNEDVAAQIIAPILKDLTLEVMWPSDFATLVAGRITIQVSTHRFSPMSIHRRLVGKTRPLFRSALGLAYLAALGPEDFGRVVEVARRLGTPDAPDTSVPGLVERRLAEVRQKGYADSVGLVEDNISAIALPVCAGGRPVGALNIAFFRSAMTPAQAAAACLGPMRRAVARAEAALAAHLGR